MDTMQEDTKPRTRRRHDDEFKQRILSECAAPGASVAKCRIPDDHIDPRRFPLFMARSAMRELIDELRRGKRAC